MKKAYILIAGMLVVPAIARAQWTAGSPAGTYYLTSGNAGIGTTAPSEKLHIAGAIRTTGSVQNNVASSGTFDFYGGSTRLASFGANNLTYGGFQFLNLTANGTNITPLVIAPSGNVGIGTTTPATTLEVVTGSTNTAAGIVLNQGTSAGNTNSGRLFFSNTGDITTNTFAVFKNADNLNFCYRSNPGTSSGTIAMVMTNTGLIGIGTTAPDSKLTVNGTIHSKEVKVDLTGWADYVFKPTYQLRKLSEIKTYIDQNQHLPEMPSEAEVQKDGINLGEMNRLLVKKVEELTLYLIEKDEKDVAKNNQLKSQQEAINQLKQQLEALTKEIHKN